MSRNFKQPGRVLDYTNATAAAIAIGSVIVFGTKVGVLIGGDDSVNTATLAVGSTGSVQICGVFELAKASADVIAQGAAVYWSTANGNITTTASGNTAAGIATAAAAGDVTTVNVLLNGLPA
jgi:predicted RecA/RadA family phage recombinase